MKFTAQILAIVILVLFVQDNEARRRYYRRGGSSSSQCTHNNQCSTGRCIKHQDYLCGAGNFIQNIFGGNRRNQRVCHTWKCAQCTSNRHCSSGQHCSGYTCVNDYQPDYNTYDNNNYGFGNSNNGFGSNNNGYGSSNYYGSNDFGTSSLWNSGSKTDYNSYNTNYQDTFKFPDTPNYNDFSSNANVPDWANF